MGTLYLVRHGQASFGSADYDQLSPLGAQQCAALGAHWRAQGLRFDAVLIGGLKRHRQSLEALLDGLGSPGTDSSTPAATVWPALDEYDSAALLRTVHPGPLQATTDPAAVKQHFRLLREALLAWMAARVQPEGMPTHREFSAGIAAVLDHVRNGYVGQRVLVVSSGGPISHAVGQVLQAPAETVVELNLRLRNSAVCEFAVSPKRHGLVSFNTVPHLEAPERLGWMTYA
jgi:broad specificity phosphatase PhoE